MPLVQIHVNSKQGPAVLDQPFYARLFPVSLLMQYLDWKYMENMFLTPENLLKT